MHFDIFFPVRYAETDQMGIVHHSNYAVWFEAGRTAFIRHLGHPYSRMESEGLLLPLIELRCVYKGSAKYEDIIGVRSQLTEVTPVRISFRYLVYVVDRAASAETVGRYAISEEADPICEGSTYHVWTDRNLKPKNIRRHNPDLYALLCETAGLLQ